MKLLYRAYDQSGKITSDVIEANNPAEATDVLRRRGLFVSEIKRGDAPAATTTSNAAKPSLRIAMPGNKSKQLRQLADFTRQLHVLITTGTPVAQALSGLERQLKDPTWKQRVGELRERVEEGLSLSEAMAEEPEVFDPIYRSLIAAGESSSEFTTMLDRLARMMKNQLKMRQTIRGTLAYPAVLITASFAALILMLTTVLPRFSVLFETMRVPLPPTTQALMMLGNSLRGYWWAYLPSVIGLAMLAAWWTHTPGGKLFVDKLLVRAPLVGSLTRSFITARIVRLLGTLIGSHIPLLDALALTAHATGNSEYQTLIETAEDKVTKGENISNALEGSDLISPSVIEAVRNGEQTGELGQVLISLAQFIEEENEVSARTLTSLLEPVILIFMGLIIGAVAISMFLPLFDLAASSGGG